MLSSTKSQSKVNRAQTLRQQESVLDWHQTNCCACAHCLDECYERNCPICIPDLDAYPPSVEQSGSQFVPNSIWPWIRGVFALFNLAILIWDIADWVRRGIVHFWMIYLTHWMYLATTIYLVLGLLETLILYRAYVIHERIVSLQDIGWVHLGRLSRAMFNVSLSGGTVVAIMFWSTLFKPSNFNNAGELFRTTVKHGAGAACVLIDGVLGASWMRHKDALFVFLFAVLYSVWAVIHWVFHFGNHLGCDCIYKPLDWNNPPSAATYTAGVNILLPTVHFVLVFALNLLRNLCNVERVWENLPIDVPFGDTPGPAISLSLHERAPSDSKGVFREV